MAEKKMMRFQRRGWLAGLLVSLLLFGLLPSLGAFAQSPAHVAIRQIEGFPAITVRVAVADENGRALRGMTQGEFVLEEDGQPITDFVLQEVERREPLYIVLVIDTSGSMHGTPLADAKAAAEQFIATLGAEDQVALYSFDEEVRLTIDFTSTHAALLPAVQSLETLPPGTGETKLYRAAYDAIQKAADKPVGQHLVLLLSDGRDTASSLTFDDVVQEALRKAVPVFTVAIDRGRPEDAAFLSEMERLALLSGGIPYRVAGSNTAGLAEQFARIADLLKWQYLLTYDSQLPHDGQLHTLRVKVCRIGECSTPSEQTFVAWPTTLTPTAVPTVATPPPAPQQIILDVIVCSDENDNRSCDPDEGIVDVNVRIVDPNTNETVLEIKTDEVGHANFRLFLDHNMRLLVYYIGGFSVEINKDRPPVGPIVLLVPPIALPGTIP